MTPRPRIATRERPLRLRCSEPYAGGAVAIEPRVEIAERGEFDCMRAHRRDPREKKG